MFICLFVGVLGVFVCLFAFVVVVFVLLWRLEAADKVSLQVLVA